MQTDLAVYQARLSDDGRPQIECDAVVETFVAQKTEQLNAMDAIVRAACAAVAAGHAQAHIRYAPALEQVIPIFAQSVEQLPADPATAGLRKTYDMATRRVHLELVRGG